MFCVLRARAVNVMVKFVDIGIKFVFYRHCLECLQQEISAAFFQCICRIHKGHSNESGIAAKNRNHLERKMTASASIEDAEC